MILPGYGPLNATFAPGADAAEERQEEAFAGEELALQAAEQPALHARVHLDAVGHVGHRAGLGADFVARRHGDHDRLHVVADDFVGDHGFIFSVLAPGPACRMGTSGSASFHAARKSW